MPKTLTKEELLSRAASIVSKTAGRAEEPVVVAHSEVQYKEAASILDKGEAHPAIAVIKKQYEDLVKALEEAKKANDGLRKAGAGDTEAATLVVARVMPKIRKLSEKANIVADQMETKFKHGAQI